MTNKIITVFGGTGFIGRHAVYALAKSGAEIRVATRLPAKAYFLRPAGVAGQIVPVFCDISDDASVASALHGATHAVYLPGILFESGDGTFEDIHVKAAERVARIAREKDLSLLVHMSALSVSSEAKSKYAKTKTEGENRVLRAFPRTAVLRPSIVFGPEDNFFNRFARMAEVFGVVPVIGGDTKFQPVYVGDVAQAIAALVAAEDPDAFYGRIYELGGPAVITMRGMMEKMLGVTGRKACIVNIPFPAAYVMGAVAGLLPSPALTVDQVRTLRSDNVAEQNSQGLSDLGIAPTPLEGVLPAYLWQYRDGGRFSA